MRHADRISLFSGIDINVNESLGLNGRCDYIIARSPHQMDLTSPVCALVEAKSENIVGGIPQCLAEMVAAQRFNRANGDDSPIYGAVTTGELWRFLVLVGTRATVGRTESSVEDLRRVFGLLTVMALGGVELLPA